MNAYEQVGAFFKSTLEGQFAAAIGDQLYELRRTDPAAWLELNQALNEVINPPAHMVGSLERQAATTRASLDYLHHQLRMQIPTLVGLMLTRAAGHYGRHAAELAAAVDPLGGDSASDMVAELLKPPRGPAEPPLSED